ncbi:MAG: hypothetical protein KDK45_23315 [Leptospiraceae bacterium]|nr:hypothetical protein [Leptospiraceae bacterium]
MDWEDIEKKIIDEVGKNDIKPVLIQAGHFSLVSDKEGTLVPTIKQETQDLSLQDFFDSEKYISDFPEKTILSGVDMALNLEKIGVDYRFCFIVNDWQWVNKGPYEAREDRGDFYKKNVFPNFYKEVFKENGVSQDKIINTDKGVYFSELDLRKRRDRGIDFPNPMTSAEEYLPFLEDILEDFNTLISYVPSTCKAPVIFATQKFLEKRSGKKILHIFYNPQDKSLEFLVLENQK